MVRASSRQAAPDEAFDSWTPKRKGVMSRA